MGNNCCQPDRCEQDVKSQYLTKGTLELSTPLSEEVLKKKSTWIQLAGHSGNFAPAGPKTVWKRQPKDNHTEGQCLYELKHDAVRDVVPKFYREVEYDNTVYLEMEDLLKHFRDPNVMDVKMGTRTFLESEVRNPELRHDLYEKMIQIDPFEPTEDERKQAAITKLRYMQFRERGSSSASLGFRIEAIRRTGEPSNTDFKKVHTRNEVSSTIQHFVRAQPSVCKQFHRRLQEIRKKFEASEYFKHHEIVGSSLLFIYDSDKHANIWMIDFAKTTHVPDKKITHHSPWMPGNHEDGYLVGLDGLIEIMKELSSRPKRTPNGKTVKAES